MIETESSLRHPLKSISPITGRYAEQTESLSPFFSEFALFKYRLKVEAEYFIALNGLNLPGFEPLDSAKMDQIKELYTTFDIKDAQSIKNIEKRTNHDVKAVEYFMKAHLEEIGLKQHKEFVHFGLTSQDVNNTAMPLMLKDAEEQILAPKLLEVIQSLKDLQSRFSDVVILARTHGQPASPTFLGKEIGVYIERLENQKSQLNQLPIFGKFGGATGNFNAHFVCYPAIDWKSFANEFLQSLGIKRQQHTTQIEHYDGMAARFDVYKRIFTILIDLCQDFWLYISFDYFKQEIKEGEVGSSAMPHKVNPINFENAEGNLIWAISQLECLSRKLPVSRMQRDLTDSTLTRNIGVPIGHGYLALNSVLKGLGKLKLNRQAIEADLNKNWVVLAEAIQNVLRVNGMENPYEQLKDLTRKEEIIGEAEIHDFIQKLDVPGEIKEKLLALSPQNYAGNPNY